MLVLSVPQSITPAKLPPLGYLDEQRLTQSTKITLVGYGTREKIVVKGEGFEFPFDGNREYATAPSTPSLRSG